MGRLILVTGGARSGKSDFAQNLALELGGDDVVFVATAEPGDEEMRRRIAAHRQSRPTAWRTVEAPRRIGEAIENGEAARVIVVDCLTLLVSNVLLADDHHAEFAVQEEVRGLMDATRAITATVIVVTNEVGLGIVPADRLTRHYRDLLGRANAMLAQRAEQVYLLISGLPIELKSLQRGDA